VPIVGRVLPVGRVPPVDGAKSSSSYTVFGRPYRDGSLSESRITLLRGARSRPLASGSCLLDVRFFRIAIFYPIFFTCEVKPAMLLIGVSFAVLGKVVAGPPAVGFLTGAAFLIGINFDTSTL